MARIPQETIDRIRDTADILDVVSRYVDMKKRGRNFFGICPFHNEKSPSFSVAPEKGIYHCFGCGVGGNAINFIMEYEKISFVDALRELGEQLGIEVQFVGGDDSRDFFSSLYEIHQLAADLYSRTLFGKRGNNALSYLKDRGLNEDSLKLYKVGFAPVSSEFLLNNVRDKNYSDDVLEKCGLFGKSNTGYYDRFRGRIMFPIFHSSGKVIAFGGRVFATDDPAKYMNSPETPLYHKSDVFYGLHLAREAIRREKTAILVEGYTDLIQLYQAGIKNVLAVSGTAFTDRHVQQIRKFTDRVYLAYDGDSAGISATLRAGYTLLKGSLEPRVILIPDELDPDDWIRRDGAAAFKTGIDGAAPLLDYHLKSAGIGNLSVTEKSSLMKDIMKEAAGISDPIIQGDLFKKLAQAFGLDEREVVQVYKKQIRKRRFTSPSIQPEKEPDLFTSLISKAELGLIQVLFGSHDEAKALVRKQLNVDLIKDDIIKSLASILMEDKKIDPKALVGQFSIGRERELVARILIMDDNLSDPLQIASDCLHTLNLQPLKDEIRKNRLKIRELEATGQDPIDIIKKVAEMQQKLKSTS